MGLSVDESGAAPIRSRREGHGEVPGSLRSEPASGVGSPTEMTTCLGGGESRGSAGPFATHALVAKLGHSVLCPYKLISAS